MDLTTVKTAVEIVSTVATLLSTFGKPVYEKIKEFELFSSNELITLGDLSLNPENMKLQGKIEGIIETRIENDSDFINKLKSLDEMLKKNFPSDAEIITRDISEKSEVKSDIETSSTATGNSKITTENVSGESKVTSKIKRN